MIADAWLIPPQHETHYRETVHRLTWGFLSPPLLPGPIPDPMPDPAAPNPAAPAAAPPGRECLGLPGDGVVYACFNRLEKITPVVFDSWLQILHQVAGSVLWIANDRPLVAARLRARLEAAGLEPARLVLSPKVDSAAFAHYCSLTDLLLASGLPLLSCLGEGFASRLGASFCAAVGMEDLICPSAGALIERPIALGREPGQLQQRRQRLLDPSAKLPCSTPPPG